MFRKSWLPTILATSLIFGGTAVYASPKANNETSQEKFVQGQQKKNQVWIGAWAASQQMPYASGISQTGFENQTVRMIVHPHASGSEIRLRFSNIYGTKPLTFDKVNVALAGEGAKTVQGSDRQIKFEGKSSITIPAGQEVLSDPIPFGVKEGDNLAVSVFVPENSGPTTWHTLANQKTYYSTGDQTTENSGSSFNNSTTSWFWLSGLDVLTKDKKARVIVTLGDSITDGYGSTLDANHRYPDYLAKRLEDKFNREVSVLNAGISGNRILQDSPIFGVKALDRLNRDVLSQTGVTDVILLEGINDIGQLPHNYNTDQIIAGMKKIADEVHAKGLRIYAGTLTPYQGTTFPDYFTEEGEITRDKVNEWIHSSGVFDGVIDFEKALVDPTNSDKILPAYDVGDRLHPNDAGYKAMADAIDLSIFKYTRHNKQNK